MELLREVNAESGSFDGQVVGGATPLTTAAQTLAATPDHAPLPTPFDLNLTREQYITLIQKVNVCVYFIGHCHSIVARITVLYYLHAFSNF